MPRTKEKLSDALAAANGARANNGSSTSALECPFCAGEVALRTDAKLRRHPGGDGVVCPGSGRTPEQAEEEAVAILDDRRAAAARQRAGEPGPTMYALALDALDPDPGNPRGEVAIDSDLEDMAESIAHHGILQPLLVVPQEPNPKGIIERWTIVFGHRRAAAARIAGLGSVPCVVRADLVGATDRVLAAQLVENLQRRDLDPIAEARAFARLHELGMTQKQIAEAVGVNQGTVSKRLALLRLPEEVLAHVGGGELDVASAVELSRLDPEVARRVADDIVVRHQAPEAALRDATRARQEQSLATATTERLEAIGVAVVDYPRWGHWSDEREDLPLSDQPEAAGGVPAWTHVVDMSADEHAFEPCHGAAVQPSSGAAVYVCLDPSRHGVESPTARAARLRSEAEAAIAAQAAAREVRAAQLAERHQATIRAARARSARGDLSSYVVDWTVAAMTGPLDPAGWEPSAAPAPLDALSTAELLGLDDFRGDLDAEVRPLVALVVAHGAARVAYAACLAAGERYLDRVEAGTGRGRGSEAVRLHLGRICSAGGYEVSDEDRWRLLGEAPPPASREPMAEGALGWYDGVDADDPSRWVTDPGEAEALAGLYPERWIPVENGGGERSAPADVDASALAPEGELPEPGQIGQLKRVAELVRCDGSGEVVYGSGATPLKRQEAPCPSCGASVKTDAKGRASRHTRPVSS